MISVYLLLDCKIRPERDAYFVSIFLVSVPILFSERGTRHDRTQDETQSNVGRNAIERRRAFAKK